MILIKIFGLETVKKSYFSNEKCHFKVNGVKLTFCLYYYGLKTCRPIQDVYLLFGKSPFFLKNHVRMKTMIGPPKLEVFCQ